MSEKDIEKIEEAKKAWLDKNAGRVTDDMFQMYTPADLKDHNFVEDVGMPGEYPYVSGRYAVPSIAAMWGRGSNIAAGKFIKQGFGYSGCGTTEDLRDFYMGEGAGLTLRGPNLAFDLPTQCGLDSDDERSSGEVGKVGVAMDTLKDFETLYEAFTGGKDLDKISSNWTINGSTNILIAMYAALAEKRGIPLNVLKGTPQNDTLKEFLARGTQIFPVDATMRMFRDTVTYCTEYMPKMNTTSISGFHMREGGASRVQVVAFTFANAIAYFEDVIKNTDLDIDTFVKRVTFLTFGGGMEVLKEVAVRRAARKVWAKIMRDRFESKNPRHWIYRETGGALAGYWTSTKQRALNNWIRTSIGAAFSAMIGDPPVPVPPFDEPLGLGHSKEATQLNADSARIIVEECKLCDVQDPFAGSYYIESLTSQYEREIDDIIKKIDDMGGATAAIKNGWMKDQITKSVVEYAKKMQTGEEIQVGVNKYTEEDEIEILPPITSMYGSIDREAAEDKQLANLKKVKSERDNQKVQDCLQKLDNAAKDEKENLIPHMIDAVKEYTTMGEIISTLKNNFGDAV